MYLANLENSEIQRPRPTHVDSPLQSNFELYYGTSSSWFNSRPLLTNIRVSIVLLHRRIDVYVGVGLHQNINPSLLPSYLSRQKIPLESLRYYDHRNWFLNRILYRAILPMSATKSNLGGLDKRAAEKVVRLLWPFGSHRPMVLVLRLTKWDAIKAASRS